jgi:hypothetical protein
MSKKMNMRRHAPFLDARPASRVNPDSELTLSWPEESRRGALDREMEAFDTFFDWRANIVPLPFLTMRFSDLWTNEKTYGVLHVAIHVLVSGQSVVSRWTRLFWLLT